MTEHAFDPDQLEGFGAAARRVVADAEEQAQDLGHQRLGTEHLLLGLLVDRGSRAGLALTRAGVNLAAARHKVAEALGDSVEGTLGRAGRTPFTARAARALSRSVRFAHARRADAVGSAHILLGVLDVEGTAGQVLRGLGVDVNRLLASLDADADADGEGDGSADDGRDGSSGADGPTDGTGEPVDLTAADASVEIDLTGGSGAVGHEGPLPHAEEVAPGELGDAAGGPGARQSADHPDARPGGPGRPGGAGGAPGTGIARPTCPRCTASLDVELVYRVVPAFGPRGTRDTLVFSCAACGGTLGVAPD